MKYLLMFLSVFSITAFAETFEQLQARAEAYRNSSQGIEAKQQQEMAERRRWLPRNNQLIITRARQFASYNFGGVVGKITTIRNEEGSIMKVDFFTRRGYRCKTQRNIMELTCVNVYNNDEKRGYMSIGEG